MQIFAKLVLTLVGGAVGATLIASALFDEPAALGRLWGCTIGASVGLGFGKQIAAEPPQPPKT